MARQIGKIAASLVLSAASVMAAQAGAVQASTATAARSSFVQVHNGHFTIGNKPFYFAGTNNYYLNYDSNAMIDDVLTKAKKMDLKVVRMWGFLDGVTENGNISMQPDLGKYDPTGFERMDYAVAEAHKLGLRLVITLVNNWDDFGGMNQYVKWVEGSSGQHDDFYTNPTIIKAYENYVKFLITRKNSITGVVYRNDPTIMTWELANEPEDKSDPSGQTITAWANTVSTFIHRLDPNHLIALGDEGWFSGTDALSQQQVAPASYTLNNGVDWDAILKLKYISYGTFHMYPEPWGSNAAWGNQWIATHIDAARSAGKPAVLEEYGEQDPNAQPGVYQSWIDTVLKDKGAGEMFWMLSGNTDNGTPYGNYDGYGVYYPSPLANVLAYGATQMDRLSKGQQPASITPKPFSQTSPSSGVTNVSLTPQFVWNPAIGADRYQLVVSTRPDLSHPVMDVTVGSTDYQSPTPLAQKTKYYWKVTAISVAGKRTAAHTESFATMVFNAKLTPFETFDEYTDDASLQANYQFNGDRSQIKLDTTGVMKDGTPNSLEVDYNVGSQGYSGVEETIKDMSWTGFKGIQFSVKSDNAGASLSLQFETKGGAYWQADNVQLQATTAPQLVKVPFSDFTVPSWNTGNTGAMNVSDVVQFSLYFGGTKGTGKMDFDSFSVYP